MSNSVCVKTILILAAIPRTLRLDKEIRSIEECIRGAVRRDLFKIITKTAVQSQDIRRAIEEEKPQIVHFCGHGSEDGSLLLEDDGGLDKPVSAQGLAALFELHKDYVDCVLLNACYSVKAAIAISEHINYAIGMNQQIQDDSAIEFAQGFYDGLGYAKRDNQDGFRRAFQEGLVAVKIANLYQAQIPVMKTKIDLDKPHKPVDIPSLVKFLAPCLPFLPYVGNQVVGGASQKLGEDVWRKAIQVWSQLQQKVQEKPVALEAVMDVALDLEDEDSQASLRKQLQKILESDTVLKAEIAKILESSVTQPTGDNIQMSGQSYDQSKFNQVGKIEGKGDINL